MNVTVTLTTTELEAIVEAIQDLLEDLINPAIDAIGAEDEKFNNEMTTLKSALSKLIEARP